MTSAAPKLSPARSYDLHPEAYQLVAFHPHFRFEGEASSDASNFVNRAPHPALHLLRQASVTAAVEAQPELAEELPQANAQKLRSLGAAEMMRRVRAAHASGRASELRGPPSLDET